MTDSDEDAFGEVFNKLRRLFRLLGEPRDIALVSAEYFKALKRWPLSAVSAGAENWIREGTRFPKPVEWIRAIPRAQPTSALPQLLALEAVEHLRAERLSYEDDPCHCAECRAANVDHRYLRFVPEFDANDRDVWAMLGTRRVTRGHWAHGEELRRWYVAKEHFWALARAAGLPKTMPKTAPIDRNGVMDLRPDQ